MNAAETATPSYPWYCLVSGHDLEQGDILLKCPVFVIPPEAAENPGKHPVRIDRQHVIVLTQSCDLALRGDGRCNADEVILAALYFRSELADDKRFGKKDGWNNAKKGRFPGYHVLNECTIEGHSFDFVLVDLRRIFTLSTEMVRDVAVKQSPRVRLLPPYREHLSQAFARFFMRVGLPVDIPDFK